jgi:high-affinity Fe2+/Pb2+ permease
MSDRSPDYVPVVASALGGFLVCLAISIATGRKEAWDAGVYFSIGIPIMCLIIFVVAFRYPHRAWRWTLWMAVGQAGAISTSGNSLSLWPLAIVAMTFVSMPQFVAGTIASKLARKRAALAVK